MYSTNKTLSAITPKMLRKLAINLDMGGLPMLLYIYVGLARAVQDAERRLTIDNKWFLCFHRNPPRCQEVEFLLHQILRPANKLAFPYLDFRIHDNLKGIHKEDRGLQAKVDVRAQIRRCHSQDYRLTGPNQMARVLALIEFMYYVIGV